MRSVSSWNQNVPVVDTRKLTPDPQYVESIGRNHGLESAVADLVDNSIDADAKNILIRIVRDAEMLRAICIADDGHGIAPERMDAAMTIGARREYGPRDLGHFGIGMKAASLGQADQLTVISRNAEGTSGRVWQKERAARDFECGVVDDAFSQAELARDWSPVSPFWTGTLIRWDAVRAFPSEPHSTEADRFADHIVRQLRQHLGLTFHRIISERSVNIVIDVEDVSSTEPPSAVVVTPIDPFGYPRPGAEGYPKVLRTTLGGVPLGLSCHIWPPRSQLATFRLPERTPADYQGFFFYRHGRLLQAGGWNHAAIPDRSRQLARVAVDLDDRALVSLFPPNPEKTAVTTPTGFPDAVRSAIDGEGITFEDYLNRAGDTFALSRRRDHSRRKVVPPGRGIAPAVRKTIKDELDFLPGQEPIEFRWEHLGHTGFFDVDFEARKVTLNQRYRWAIVGDGSGSLNDAPLVKAMLFLLVEQLFAGAYLGRKDKDDLALYQAVLSSAAELEAQ